MDLVKLALACYRNPLAYQDQWSLGAPLPENMGCLLALANGAPALLDEAVQQTGVKASELREAARFCVQQWCLASGASAHRILGVEPDASLAKIKEHHRQLIRLFHPDHAAGRETWTEHYASRINAAYTQLCRKTGNGDNEAALQPRSLSLGAEGSARSHRVLETQWLAVSVARPRSDRRRHGISAVLTARSRWSAWKMLSVLLLTLGLIGAVFYADQWFTQQYELKLAAAKSVSAPSPETRIASTSLAPQSQGIFEILRATPNWEALDQREIELRQRMIQAQNARTQWEEERRQQIAAETALLEKLRDERAKLEQQLKREQVRFQQVQTERFSAEQQVLAELKSEQQRLEQLRQTREAEGQQRLAAFQAEQLKTAKLAEQLQRERQRLEHWQAERQKVEQQRVAAEQQRQAQAEAVQAERVRLEQEALRQAQAERQRLEEQLKAERARTEQALAERAQRELKDQQAKLEQDALVQAQTQPRLEPQQQAQVDEPTPSDQQSQVEQMRAKQVALRQAQAERQHLEEQLKAEQAKIAHAQAERVKLAQARKERARVEQETLRQAQAVQQTDKPRDTAQKPVASARKVQTSTETATDRPALVPTALAVTAEPEARPADAEVKSLMRRYVASYRRGDLNRVLSLFTASARNRIQSDYAALFSTHNILALRLQGMQWRYRGASAEGSGSYVLKVQQRETGEQRQIQGRIYFTVQKRGHRVLISAIEFEWPSH